MFHWKSEKKKKEKTVLMINTLLNEVTYYLNSIFGLTGII